MWGHRVQHAGSVRSGLHRTRYEVRCATYAINGVYLMPSVRARPASWEYRHPRWGSLTPATLMTALIRLRPAPTVPSRAAICPPEENPYTPPRCGLMPRTAAWAFTHKIARAASS